MSTLKPDDETRRTKPPQAGWEPSSWKLKTALQQPVYDDAQGLAEVLGRLRALPPLVTSWEVETLKSELAEATVGRRFLLQGGECAESLDSVNADAITSRLKLMLQMSLVLVFGLRIPVIRVGRFAGQYAKPRSAISETRDGVTLPSYRGDIINRSAFSAADRSPDPELMLDAYGHSALTLNFVRALSQGGFADLHHPEYWNVDFLAGSPLGDEYLRLVDSIRESVRFMEAIHEGPLTDLEHVTFYTSHEALLLPYEEALTRSVPRRDGSYNLSTHFPWLGVRTSTVGEAHVEYARGIENPIGVKVGPDQQPSELKSLIRVLNPADVPGRLTLITRLGTDEVEQTLPALIEAVRATGSPVLWCCDPMHGNTEVSATGYKTRKFERIRAELELSFDVLEAAGSHLGGVHFELTGENVTECVGGAGGISDSDLSRAYRTSLDPRLNAEQALEIAFSIVRKHR